MGTHVYVFRSACMHLYVLALSVGHILIVVMKALVRHLLHAVKTCLERNVLLVVTQHFCKVCFCLT